MLSPRFKNAAFVVLLSACVAGVVSLVMTLRINRLDAGFVDHWMRAMLIALVAAVPAALLLASPLRRAAEWMCR